MRYQPKVRLNEDQKKCLDFIANVLRMTESDVLKRLIVDGARDLAERLEERKQAMINQLKENVDAHAADATGNAGGESGVGRDATSSGT